MTKRVCHVQSNAKLVEGCEDANGDEDIHRCRRGRVAVAWVVASIAASVYLSQADSANRTYGLIAAVIAAIVWLYWSNLLFLVGAVLNARVEDAPLESPVDERQAVDQPEKGHDEGALLLQVK